MTRHLHRRLSLPLVSVALLAGAVAVAHPFAGVSSAAEPAQRSVPFTAVHLPTWQTNGTAWTSTSAGGRVFVGGRFSAVRPPGAAAGTSEQPRGNFVVLDAATGTPTPCAPRFSYNGSVAQASVRALHVSPDEKTLYIGGRFTSVGGTALRYVVALDIASCTVRTSFAPRPGASVYAIAATPSTVYLGGSFPSMGGAARARAAAVSATTGALQPWKPSFDGIVRALALQPGAPRVVAGGDFDAINGVGSHALGVVDAGSGAVVKAYPLPFIAQTSTVRGIAVDSTGFYTAHEGKGPGVFDGRIALDWSTYDQRWRDTCRGATQAVRVYRGTLYSASHAHDCSSVNSFPEGPRYHLLAQGTDNRKLLPWFPNTNEGVTIGPRDLTIADTSTGPYLWTVGEFTKVNGVPQQGLTRFGTGLVTAKPTAPQVYAESTVTGDVHVRWQRAWDPDDATLTYRVYRAGRSTPLKTVAAASSFWFREGMAFLDTAPAAGSRQRYRVSASDGRNTTSSPWFTVAVRKVPASAYRNRVRADKPLFYWRYDEPRGSFVSAGYGFRAGTLTGGPATFRGAGALAGDASRALTLSGQGTTIHTEARVNPPKSFTAETWFKTTTTTGGKILGFGESQVKRSPRHDRHIIMRDDGRITFGVHSGGRPQELTTPRSYNDGRWHHVVAVQGTDGMVLYVDGVALARNTAVGGQGWRGYWRVGGDAIHSSWPTRPTSEHWAGSVDETAVYSRALPASTIAAHYTLGRG